MEQIGTEHRNGWFYG